MEEAYIFLEVDHPAKVELKKKGIALPFNVRDKDIPLESSTNSKVKLRHFS